MASASARALIFTAAALFTALLSACADSRTVGLINQSDTTLRVRFWVGDRAAQTSDPNSQTAMATDHAKDVRPGEQMQHALTSQTAFKSAADSIVRFQARAFTASFDKQREYWYEVNPPGPYILRVYGDYPDLRFERQGQGTMTAVPKNLWLKSPE